MKSRTNKFTIAGLVLVSLLALSGCRPKPVVEEQPIPIDTRYTDGLTMASGDANGAYQGRSFFQGGVSVATNPGHIDGDTTNFTIGSQRISIRYLGIDTPESTAVIQPWGKAASAFVKQQLDAAVANNVEIRLEAESQGTDSTGNRYLGWVWIGDRLLNLEILENAYSRFTMNLTTHYHQTFVDAQTKTIKTKTRVYGTENDPDFNYSQDVKNITLKEYNANYEEHYDGSRVQTEGYITRKISGNLFIQDQEYDEDEQEYKQYGAYIYVGPGGMDLSGFPLGTRVRLIGQVNVFSDSFQISIGAFRNELKVISEVLIEPVVTTMSGEEDFSKYEYMLVLIEDLLVTAKLPVASGATRGDYTVYATTSAATEISLRISADLGYDPYAGIIEVGNHITIRGVVVIYFEGHQILIGSQTSLHDVVKLS